MKQKLKISRQMILSLLPAEPDGYLGYEVTQKSHMWWTVHLLHPPYTYKEGVRTIWGFVKSNGDVYAPLTAEKPQRTMVCKVPDLFKQNPYTLIKPKDLGYSLLSLL